MARVLFILHLSASIGQPSHMHTSETSLMPSSLPTLQICFSPIPLPLAAVVQAQITHPDPSP